MTDHDLEQRLRAWYRTDIDERESAPQQLRADLATLTQTAGSSRGPLTTRWRSPRLSRFAPIGLAATVVAAAILIGIGLIVRSLNIGPPSVPIATPFPTTNAQNGRIAVSANPKDVGGGEVGDIYLVAEGAAARRIIGSDGDGVAEACPRFSPDGRRLAYGEARASAQPVSTFRGVWPVSDRAVVVVGLNDQGDPSPAIMHVTAGADAGPIPCPEWSPNGRYVAFRVGPELWIADTASGETRVVPIIPEAGWEQNDLEWSRDGSLIAVSEPGQIRVVRMDGGPSTLIPVKGATPGSLGWTAGDDRIIYISSEDPPLGNRRPVNVVRVDGNNDTQLTPESADPLVQFYSDDAVVSPDGTRVAYVQVAYRCDNNGCSSDSPGRLLTMGTAGSNVVELPIPPGYGVSGLQWSPDGERLLFGSIDGVVSVAVALGSPAIVYSRGELNLEWSASEITWQPVYP
jgi:Tol biopolymer transport system component